MATLKTFRRDAAAQLALLDVVTTTDEAAGPDAEVSVIVEAFRGAQASTLYENAYVYPIDGVNAHQQRPTRTSGLIQASATLKVAWPWDVPVAAGTELEILRLVPAVSELGRSGWNAIINDVLRDIPTIRRFPVTATEGTVRYTVPVWLETEDQAIGIYAPGTYGVPQVLSTNLKSIAYDGEVVELELWTGYAAGSVFHLAAYQPTAARVKTIAGWADSPVGLVEDDDEALADRRLVRASALVRAAEIELQRPDPRNKALWERTLDRWVPVAASLKRRLVPARPAPSMTVSAPVFSGWPKGLCT